MKEPSTTRRPLAKMRPSYIVFLSALPFAMYLFFNASDYQDALRFIVPGLTVTVFVTVVAYVVASLLGLGLAALLALSCKPRTLFVYSSIVLVLAAVSVWLFNRPQVTYRLIGDTSGRVAILPGTPGRISDRVRDGTYAEDAQSMAVRGVETVAVALERLEEGIVSAALLPIDLSDSDEVPDDASNLWEVTFLPDSARNPALTLMVLAAVLGVLTFASWQTSQHPLAIFRRTLHRHDSRHSHVGDYLVCRFPVTRCHP